MFAPAQKGSADREGAQATAAAAGNMAVLTIQSSVAYGHVGNAAAVFCLRRAGIEAWPVDTVALSHHPGYGSPGGGVRPPAEIAGIIAGLDRIGVLGRCRAVISGYLGAAATADVVADTVARVRLHNPDAIYLCDPVMGDRDPGLYVAAPVEAAITRCLVPIADVITPNQFELERLSGAEPESVGEAVIAARSLLGGRPRLCVVTSLLTRDLGCERIATLAVTADAAWLATTPRLALRAKGAGDAFAALFLAALLDGEPVARALPAAVSSLYRVIEATVAADADELRLVAAQAALGVRQVRFAAERLGEPAEPGRGCGLTP